MAGGAREGRKEIGDPSGDAKETLDSMQEVKLRGALKAGE